MINAPIPVKLDRVRHVAWSNAAIYRLSLLTLQPQGTYGLIVQIIWACLVPGDASAFTTPEHIAEFLPVERAEELLEIVSKLMPKKKKSGEPETEAEAKNAVGSTA